MDYLQSSQHQIISLHRKQTAGDYVLVMKSKILIQITMIMSNIKITRNMYGLPSKLPAPNHILIHNKVDVILLQETLPKSSISLSDCTGFHHYLNIICPVNR